MCDIARIDRFLDDYPDAEFGPAHIVLSDANLKDWHIDWCLSLLDSLLDGKPWPEDVKSIDPSMYRNHLEEELRATQIFLRELRALPPTERVQPGDRICDGVESLDLEVV
jgi:hypothetical protein